MKHRSVERNVVGLFSGALRSTLLAACVGLAPAVLAEDFFQLPTANRAIFEPGGAERYFVGTVGKPHTSGYFGCVRSEARQMHEGIDIRSVQRGKRGEPADPVLATADGVVTYVSTKPALSNYGKYLIVRHEVEGIEAYSLYAHLSEIAAGIQPGQRVKTGERIATMGRTANTRQGISKDRAHLHFELNLLLNEGFASWYRKRFPDQRNDHGMWNGQNLLAIDPRLLFLAQQRQGAKFSLEGFIQSETELCRVIVRKANFPWVRRYRSLVEKNSLVEKDGVAAYELVLNYNGLPIRAIPRAASEIKPGPSTKLISVNEAEQRRNPCRSLVSMSRGKWDLTQKGRDLLDLLTY